MPKQCPLKMAAAMTQQDFSDINKLQGGAYGYSLCFEAECAWWSLEYEACAIPRIGQDLSILAGIVERKTQDL